MDTLIESAFSPHSKGVTYIRGKDVWANFLLREESHVCDPRGDLDRP